MFSEEQANCWNIDYSQTWEKVARGDVTNSFLGKHTFLCVPVHSVSTHGFY